MNDKYLKRLQASEDFYTAISRLIQFPFPVGIAQAMGQDAWEKYLSLRHDVHMEMLNDGWCFGCRTFDCVCQDDDL